MASGDLLFVRQKLYDTLSHQTNAAKVAVEALDGDELLNRNPEDLCTELEVRYKVTVPHLKSLSTQIDQEEIAIDVSHNPERFISDRSRPHYIKGTEISFFVPYEGDKGLFFCQPNTFTHNPPRAEVRDGELIFRYSRLDHDAKAVEREYYTDLRSVEQWLQWQDVEVNEFNKNLRSHLTEWIALRRAKVLNDKGMVAALKFPMRQRVTAQPTYVAPEVRRKPTMVGQPAPASTKPFKPEPTLEAQEYEHILSVISNMVHVMERSPVAFKNMKEEDLRQHFLVQLNGQYEGQATGETFNFAGKTDILIRVEGKNIFIAECKFWRGPESLRETIDQLSGYTSWRDTKTALVIFNRDRQLSTILPKIGEVFKAHPNFKREMGYNSETGFRFVMHHRDDTHRELIVTVLVFELPA